MSVACPATRRDGRRRLKLRNKEAKVKSSNLSLQTSKVKIFKLESSDLSLQTSKVKSSNLSLQTSKVKVFKVKSRKLSNIEVVEYWKLSKLNLESCLKVVKHWSCWILRIVKVESCSILKVESCQSWKCWILKVC